MASLDVDYSSSGAVADGKGEEWHGRLRSRLVGMVRMVVGRRPVANACLELVLARPQGPDGLPGGEDPSTDEEDQHNHDHDGVVVGAVAHL